MTQTIETKSANDLFAQFDTADMQPREVFGRFLYEGELGILFGDSNTGKSILANDIAFFVSGGGHGAWGDQFVSPNIPAMYVDMEMEARQWVQRYRPAREYITDEYQRAEVRPTKDANVFAAVKSNIIFRQADKDAPKFIIIDNITNGFGNITNANKMKELIFGFKELKERFGLTILLIAHCPKRKSNKELTQNDLGGSKMIINFVDSAFAIGQCCDKKSKYIKQIKSRAGEKYGDVLVARITDEPYLCMKPMSWHTEWEAQNDNYVFVELSPEKEIELVKLLKTADSWKYADIAEQLGLPDLFVMRYAAENNMLVLPKNFHY